MGKKYNAKAQLIEKGKVYALGEAVTLVKQLGIAKFDETLDLSVRLGVDPKKSDQQVRGTVVLPHGSGRAVKIAVIVKVDKVKEAEEAGADVVGGEDMIPKIEGGWMDFDVLIVTPDLMAKVGKLGKVLGRRGLMPSPKNGTVTNDVAKTIKEFKAGKIEFKADKFGIVHLPVGKLSFSEEKLAENVLEVYKHISRAKPTASKGTYFRSIVLSPTMGPGVSVETLIK